MSIDLKLDGRTSRGISWNKLKNCGKPINQGVLVSNKCCSNCHVTPDTAEVIKCMKCNHLFHTKCLLKPLEEYEVQTIASNPSFWWFCLDCICLKSGDCNQRSEADNMTEPLDVLLHNTLASFKKDMLTFVGETIEKKLENHNLKSNSKSVICSNNLPSLGSNPSGVGETGAWRLPPAIQTSDANTNRISEKTLMKTSVSKMHVVILDPNDSDNINHNQRKKNALKLVNNAVDGINVNFCKMKDSGVVALGFADAKSKELAVSKLNDDSELSDMFVTRSPKKASPKVTIHGVNELLFDGCDGEDRGEMKSILLEDILKRNTEIRDLINSGSHDFLEVIMLQKVMPTDIDVTFTAALKMSTGVRKLIKRYDDRIYVSLSRCKVFDRYYVTQCFHCQRFGHLSNNCRDNKNGVAPTCLYCAEHHRSANCPNKSCKEKMCCSNCLKSNDPNIKAHASMHNAASLDCSLRKAIRENIRQKTADCLEKN